MPNLMYHFIGGDERLKGISLQGFRAQLDHLLRNHRREDVVLTFDHGTLDHIEVAAPELERRGLTGVFFILTMVQEEGRIPTIDKQRLLEVRLRSELAGMLCDRLRMPYRPEDAREFLAAFRFYSPEERYLRYLRDKVVPAKEYAEFIDALFRDAHGDERAFASKVYMGWDHVIQLQRRGHVIGSHTHHHYGDLGDFARSLELLEARLGQRPRCISYPNGWIRISHDELKNLRVDAAYDSSETHAGGDYRLGRIDCNQFAVH
jgi:peptidoglycan/xylan/chitin deacetylase (PgdA/CDA1 family)